MSDLAATSCNNNDCGCSNNRSGFLFGNGDCCDWIWLIILFSLFNNSGCGCGNSRGFSNGNCCDWLIIILLLFFCNGHNDDCGCC